VTLRIPPPVVKQLAGLLRADAERLLERIAAAPRGRHRDVVPLSGAPGSYRLRWGRWWAVFSIEDGDVILDRIAHRPAHAVGF